SAMIRSAPARRSSRQSRWRGSRKPNRPAGKVAPALARERRFALLAAEASALPAAVIAAELRVLLARKRARAVGLRCPRARRRCGRPGAGLLAAALHDPF